MLERNPVRRFGLVIRSAVRRPEVAEHIAELVGPGQLRITDAKRGWPALGELVLPGAGPTDVALFVAPVTLSNRDRDDVERRFQNPGQDHPLVVPAGREPLLLGLWEHDDLLHVERPLLASADRAPRQGLHTRYSVFVGLGTLLAAESAGWAETTSASGEVIRCFRPSLLPVSAMADIAKVPVPEAAVQVAIEASGLDAEAGPTGDAAAARARPAASSIVRDQRFSKRVIDAYQHLCAMCGLDLGLVQEAHIYPAAAPGSEDEPWNGLALCANHHLAFDHHLIWVRPSDRQIRLHPRVLEQERTVPAVESLVSGTFRALAEPVTPAARPRADMFEQRYRYFGDAYAWAS